MIYPYLSILIIQHILYYWQTINLVWNPFLKLESLPLVIFSEFIFLILIFYSDCSHTESRCFLEKRCIESFYPQALTPSFIAWIFHKLNGVSRARKRRILCNWGLISPVSSGKCWSDFIGSFIFKWDSTARPMMIIIENILRNVDRGSYAYVIIRMSNISSIAGHLTS